MQEIPNTGSSAQENVPAERNFFDEARERAKLLKVGDTVVVFINDENLGKNINPEFMNREVQAKVVSLENPGGDTPAPKVMLDGKVIGPLENVEIVRIVPPEFVQ